MVIKVRDLNHLKNLADTNDGQSDRIEFCFSNGYAKTTKNILYCPIYDNWEVFHYSSDVYEEWKSTKQFVDCMFTGGMICDAIEKGEFYVYEP